MLAYFKYIMYLMIQPLVMVCRTKFVLCTLSVVWYFSRFCYKIMFFNS